MEAEIICVGTELLLGDIVNTNAQYLSQQLSMLGISVMHQHVVGDNAHRLRELVRQAMQRSQLLIFSGGLGPTADDLTKETVAQAFGDPLHFDEEEWAKITAHFARTHRPITENNRKQAMVPTHGHKLVNDRGTAPGCWFENETCCAALMPGVPHEMKAMWEESVRGLLLARQNCTLHSITLRVLGGESQIESQVSDLLANANPTAAIYCKTGECEIRITAKAADDAAAQAMCRDYSKNFYSRLGTSIYDADVPGLEYTVVHALQQRGLTVATAESLTGGTVAQRLTAVPGASSVLGFGYVTYSEKAKQQLLGVPAEIIERYNVVSAPVAARMALGAKQASGADIAVSLTGLAGPDGGTEQLPLGTVYVGAAMGNRVWVKHLTLGYRGREIVRQRSAAQALDMVRRLALGLEIPEAKCFAADTPAQEQVF